MYFYLGNNKAYILNKLNICNVKNLIKLLQFSYSYEEKLIIIAIYILQVKHLKD